MGVKGAAAFTVYAAMVLAAASPFLVPVATVLLVVWSVLRRRKNKLALAAAMATG
jgi:hypothetical protein